MDSSVKCIDCANLDLKSYPDHAKNGLGQCRLETKLGVFGSWLKPQECARFRLAPADVQQKRIEWATKLGGNTK